MSTAAAVELNPFPGLRPFREEEENFFFGREAQVDAILDILGSTRLLAITGASSSGKSSLIKCGLLPALRGGRLTETGSSWVVVSFRPGIAPIQSLARALIKTLYADHDTDDTPSEKDIETILRASKRGLIDVFERAPVPEKVNLMVVVDPFEELFRLGPRRTIEENGDGRHDDDEGTLVNLLLEGLQADAPVYVTLAVRSDYLEECAQFVGLSQAINEGHYLIPRMMREECQVAITGPVAMGGTTLEAALVTRLINDASDRQDQLAILQHALNRTWAYWQGEQVGKGVRDSLALSHYEAIGTMDQALDSHAEQAYAALKSVARQRICEKLFKALTYKGTDRRGGSRATKLVTLCALAGANEADAISEVISVIDVFRAADRAFLTPPLPEPLRAETVVDLSHESLIRGWRRLKHWVDEEADAARMYIRLAESTLLYEAGKTSLWRDPDLQLAEDWREANNPTLHWALQYHPAYEASKAFLDASLAHRAEETKAAAALQQRELDRATALAAAKVEAARRSRAFFLVAVCIAVIALLMALLIWNSGRLTRIALADAERQRQAAVVGRDSLQEALDEAIALRLEAEQQRDMASETIAEMLRETDFADGALPDGLLPDGVLPSVELQSDEAGQNELPTVQNASPPEQPTPTSVVVSRRTVSSAVATKALDQIARGNKSRGAMLAREAFLFNQANGGGSLNDLYDVLRQALNSLQPNLGGPQNTQWNAPVASYTPGDTAQATHPGSAVQAKGYPDGVVRLETQDDVIELRGHQGPVSALTFSADGTMLASGGGDQRIRLWKVDPATGIPARQPFLVLTEQTGGVVDLYFEGNGETLLARSADQTAHRWAVRPERMLETICAVMGRGYSLTRSEWNRYVGSGIGYDEHAPCPE